MRHLSMISNLGSNIEGRDSDRRYSVKCLFCLYLVCTVCCVFDVINLIGASPSTPIEHHF